MDTKKNRKDIKDNKIDINGFADTSENAYGCCLYIRCTNRTGSCVVKLLCIKSKVVPLKSSSLPRLELCVALLQMRLSAKFVPKLKIKIKQNYFWSDSTIVLSWIASLSTKWKRFVANRVSEIKIKKRHVNTHENPADVISRGCWQPKLPTTSLW